MDPNNPKEQLKIAEKKYSEEKPGKTFNKGVLNAKIGYFKVRVKLNELITDNQIAICVLFGMLGFIYAIGVLLFPYGRQYTPYGEIYISNKTPIVSTLLEKRLKLLADSDKKLSVYEHTLLPDALKANADPVKKADLSRIQATRTQIGITLPLTRKELFLLQDHNKDTSMAYFAKYLYVNKTSYLVALRSVNWKDDADYTENVSGFAVDTCPLLSGTPQKYPIKLELKQHKRKQLMDFIGDYPAFGLWIVLTIAQMMLWFLLCPMLAANLLNLKDKLGDSYRISIRSRIVSFLLPATFVGIFCIAFYKGLADSRLITNYYFLTSYNFRMFCYAFPGYMVAIFCFTGYLTLAKQFDNMDNEAEKDSSLLSNTAFIAKFQSLKNAFENSFICSAIVLSFMILWLGNVVYAVNSIEVFKFYAQIAGQPLIPGDFIYLVGLLHTCILLTFYIPVKLKFGTLNITQQSAMADGDVPTKNIFQTMFSNLGPLLVTTSPLIASFTQNIFHLFFKQ